MAQVFEQHYRTKPLVGGSFWERKQDGRLAPKREEIVVRQQPHVSWAILLNSHGATAGVAVSSTRWWADQQNNGIARLDCDR